MGLCIRMELDLGMGTGLRSSDQGLPSGPPNAGGPGSIPGLGTRSHAATKTQCSQVNKHFILKFFK